MNIGVAGETRGRQHAFAAGDIVAGETHAFGQLEPALDTPLAVF